MTVQATICDRCSDRGMCCRYIELPLARPLTADEGTWVELHPGVHMIDAATIHINVACRALTPEGYCGLFGTEARPRMCSVWPDAFYQIPDGCAYKETFIPAKAVLEVTPDFAVIGTVSGSAISHGGVMPIEKGSRKSLVRLR